MLCLKENCCSTTLFITSEHYKMHPHKIFLKTYLLKKTRRVHVLLGRDTVFSSDSNFNNDILIQVVVALIITQLKNKIK